MKRLRTLLDYFQSYTKLIEIRCNCDTLVKADRITILKNHSILLNRELIGFDVENDTLIVFVKPEEN